MSELLSSQRLKDNVEVNDIREFWFADKNIMAAAFREMGQGDISASDLPDFKEEVRFSSAEWIDLVRNIETRAKEDKKRIIQEVISQKTQKRTQDLRSEVDFMEAEKKKIKDALADLSPNKIETSLVLVETLLKYVPEQYQVLLWGYAGSLILDTFEKHDQRIVLRNDNTVEVVSFDKAHMKPELQQNNIDLALRMNALIGGGKLDTNILRTGMLYRAESFDSYSKNLRDINGQVMNPEDAQNPEKYLEYLQAKKDSWNPLSPSEETVLASGESIRHYPLMIPAIEQFREFDTFKSKVQKQVASVKNQDTGWEQARDDKTPNGGGAPSAIGEWIGQIWGTIGKLAAAGAGGGMRVFGEVFNSAVKEWGPWGAAAVIGGFIYAIFKGGFWKTLGAIFGIGLMSEASAGRVNLDLDGTSGKGKGSGGKPSEPVEEKKMNPRTTPNSPNVQTDGKKQAKERIFKHEKLQALSVEKKELAYKTLAESPEFMNKSVLDLENAFYTRGTSSLEQFFGDIKEINLPDGSVMAGSQVYKSHKDELRNAIEALLSEKEPTDTKVANLFERTSVNSSPVAPATGQGNQESGDSTVNKGSQAKIETETVSNSQPPADIFTLSEGYSDLYLLSRLMTQGYIPQLSDNMWDKTKWAGLIANSWSGLKYLSWDGAFFTNNKDSKNPLVGAWHKWIADKVAAMTTELAKEEKKAIKEAIEKMKSTGNVKDALSVELQDRLEKVNGIERILAENPVNPQKLKAAMASYTQATKTKWDVIRQKTGVILDGVFKKPLSEDMKKDAESTIKNGREDVQKVAENLEKISEDIETKKKGVLDAMDDWNKNPTDEAKKTHAMNTLEEYNKYVVGVEGGVAEKFSVLEKEELEVIGKKSKVGTWLKKIIDVNIEWKNFGAVEKAGKWTSETPYIKGMKRGFVGVGVLTLAWNGKEWFTDLLKWGTTEDIMKRTFDLGIGMVPFAGTLQDMAILNFESYEQWILGAKMSPEEREMRKYMAVLGIIPGVGIGFKAGGRAVKSAMTMKVGSTLFKTGNLAWSLVSYGMLGASIHHTYQEYMTK